MPHLPVLASEKGTITDCIRIRTSSFVKVSQIGRSFVSSRISNDMTIGVPCFITPSITAACFSMYVWRVFKVIGNFQE